jgi:hypothetical protein
VAYPDFVTKILDLFARIAANDKKLSNLHQARPAGISRHLRSAELVARGLESFGRDNPSLTQELKLPDWEQPTKLAWPPPQVPLGVLVAQSMASAPHPGGNWWQHNQERAAAVREEQQRVSDYYADQARRHEERENAEAQERAEQARRAAHA